MTVFGRQFENSDVLPSGAVAVAAIPWPAPIPKKPKPRLNVASPLKSVKTEVPENVGLSPSPKPLTSQVATKNSSSKTVFGAPSKVPSTFVVEPRVSTVSMTGAFWRPFGPLSRSSSSFALGPAGSMSIPRPPLSWVSTR